jgi:hypothetical protein
MANAYLFVMLAVTPSESREVALSAVSRGIEAAASSTDEIRLSAIHFWLSIP